MLFKLERNGDMVKLLYRWRIYRGAAFRPDDNSGREYNFLNEKSEFHSEIPHSAGHADRQAGRLVKYGY